MDNSADILTIEEVATFLRCSRAHVQNALRGKVRGLPCLTHLAIGRRKVIPRAWLQQWMETSKGRRPEGGEQEPMPRDNQEATK
jgi:hypothetical protein